MRCPGCGVTVVVDPTVTPEPLLVEADTRESHGPIACSNRRNALLVNVLARHKEMKEVDAAAARRMLRRCIEVALKHECYTAGETDEARWRCFCKENIAVALKTLSPEKEELDVR